MKYSAPMRAFAILLAFVCGLMLPGCSTVRTIVDTVAGENTLSGSASPSPTASATASAQTSYAPPPSTVPFPDMAYERPDVAAMTAEIADASKQINADVTEEKALTLLGNVQNIYNDFRTAETLAMIHNSIDHADTYWQQEFSYCTRNETAIQEAMTTFNRALSSSQVGQAAGLEPPQDPVDSQALMPLLNAEAELKNRYNSFLATATAEYEGVTYTYAQCTTSAMTTNWTEQNAHALGDLYLQLVNVRNQIATASGFNNYIEYSYHVSETDYTPEMVSALLESIARELGPLYEDMSAKGIYSIDIRLSEEDVFENLNTIFSRLDPALTGALEFMRQYELYDFSNGINKEASDYTTYIVNYAAPFMLVTFDGSWEQASTIINEFGHFFNYTQDPDASYHTLDTLEIFSEALELIATNYYGECFSEEDAYMMTYNTLANSYATFPYQAYLTAFEYEAYSLQDADLTYDNLCDISARQWERFGFDTADPMARIDWTVTPHLFDSAFYTFSYILAGDIAMQLWETSLVDPKNAMQIYMNLMDGAKDDLGFLENVQDAGLISPFADEEMATLAGYFRTYLIHEAGMYQSAIASPAVTSSSPVPSPTQPTAQATFPIVEPSGRYGTYHGYTDGDTSVETYGDPIDPNATPKPTPTPRPTRSRYNSMNHNWDIRSYAAKPLMSEAFRGRTA